MPIKLDLLISVVVYRNSPLQVQRLLNSVRDCKKNVHLRFVDNDPQNTAIIARDLPAFASYLPMEENVGYGRGHNAVILDEDYEADFHLICNPDIYFASANLDRCIDFMRQKEQISLLMPRITWPDGRDQGLRKLLPRPFDLFLRRFIPARFRGMLDGQERRYQLLDLDADKPMFVPALSGCFMLCRADRLKALGGFDPHFFLYLEDVDLSRRLGQVGLSLYWPEVEVVHEYQKDSYRSGWHLKRHLESALYYFSKHGWFLDAYRRKVNKRALTQEQRADQLPQLYLRP